MKRMSLISCSKRLSSSDLVDVIVLPRCVIGDNPAECGSYEAQRYMAGELKPEVVIVAKLWD